MFRHLHFVGLGLAVVAAGLLAVLPIERAIGFSFPVLLLGLVLFGIGMFTRLAARRRAIGAAMRRFAEAEGLEFRESLSAEGLPPLGPFGRGTKRVCGACVGVVVAGHAGLLFRFEYNLRGVGTSVGNWNERIVLYLPDAWQDRPHVQFVPHLLGGSHAEVGEAVRARLAELPDLAIHANRDGLVVWDEASVATNWRLGWQRSFRSFDDWIADSLRQRIVVATALLERDGNDERNPGDAT